MEKSGPAVVWEKLPNEVYVTRRLRVPGGWLIAVSQPASFISVTYIPDARHEWQLE